MIGAIASTELAAWLREVPPRSACLFAREAAVPDAIVAALLAHGLVEIADDGRLVRSARAVELLGAG